MIQATSGRAGGVGICADESFRILGLGVEKDDSSVVLGWRIEASAVVHIGGGMKSNPPSDDDRRCTNQRIWRSRAFGSSSTLPQRSGHPCQYLKVKELRFAAGIVISDLWSRLTRVGHRQIGTGGGPVPLGDPR